LKLDLARYLNGKPFKVVAPESQETFELFLNKASKNAKNEKDSIQRRKKWFFFFSTKRLFVDVKYTFASTIHKLQGSTYKTVYIDLIDIENIKDKDLMYRLLYVAITRASEEIKVLLPNDENNLLGSYQNDILNSLNNFFIE
jgi:superfamily I DNA/RNA helicase